MVGMVGMVSFYLSVKKRDREPFTQTSKVFGSDLADLADHTTAP
jgi:hypothetical protein